MRLYDDGCLVSPKSWASYPLVNRTFRITFLANVDVTVVTEHGLGEEFHFKASLLSNTSIWELQKRVAAAMFDLQHMSSTECVRIFRSKTSDKPLDVVSTLAEFLKQHTTGESHEPLEFYGRLSLIPPPKPTQRRSKKPARYARSYHPPNDVYYPL